MTSSLSDDVKFRRDVLSELRLEGCSHCRGGGLILHQQFVDLGLQLVHEGAAAIHGGLRPISTPQGMIALDDTLRQRGTQRGLVALVGESST